MPDAKDQEKAFEERLVPNGDDLELVNMREGLGPVPIRKEPKDDD